MAAGRKGEHIAGQNMDKYISLWQKSLTLEPLTESKGKVVKNPDNYIISLHLSPPELIAVVIK